MHTCLSTGNNSLRGKDRTHGKSKQEDRGGKVIQTDLKKSNTPGVDMCTDLY